MTLTLRQLRAWLDLTDRVDRFEQAKHMMTTAVGAQGSKQDRDNMLKELL